MRQVKITGTRLAAFCLLWVVAQAIGGCGAEMGKNSPKDDTGAPGTLLDGSTGGSVGFDASAGGADAARDVFTSPDTTTSDVAGTSGGGASGSSVAGGSGLGGSGGGGAGGAALDACAACERSSCKIAQPTTSKLGAYQAFAMCFSSLPWAGKPDACENGIDPTKIVATQGPAKGTAKAELCQAVLKCARTAPSKCADGDDFDKCYCGTVDTFNCYSGGQNKPDGDCKSAIEDAAETDDPVTMAGRLSNPCTAAGAAYTINQLCDNYCCRKECLGAADAGPFNAQWCLAPGSVGTGGAGSTGTSSGSGGSGSAGGTGGDASSGTAGSGTAGSGTAGTSGIAGTSGVAGTSGIAGTSGVAGTSGIAGTSGAAGAGAAGASLLENFRFLGNTVPWKVSGKNAASNFGVDDAEGTGTTGSLWLGVTLGDVALTTEAAAFQCLTTTAGETFDVDAAVKVPDQTTSRGVVELVAYRSDGCWGPVMKVTLSSQVSDATWGHVTVSAQTPATAQSVAVQLVTVKLAGHDQAAALFDSVLVTRR